MVPLCIVSLFGFAMVHHFLIGTFWCGNILVNPALNCQVELVLCSSSVMDCHATAWGSIPDGNDVLTKLLVLRKGQEMGVLSLNDLTVDGT